MDPSKRQVLPASAAVKARRFSTSRHWAPSAQIREVMDLHVPQTPKPERTVDHSESIILDGNVIENRLTTGAHVVRQRRVVDHLPTLSVELAVVEPEVYERVVAPSLAADADAALARLDSRRAHARRSHRLNRPATKAPRAASTGALVIAIIVAVVVAAAWLYSAVTPIAP